MPRLRTLRPSRKPRCPYAPSRSLPVYPRGNSEYRRSRRAAGVAPRTGRGRPDVNAEDQVQPSVTSTSQSSIASSRLMCRAVKGRSRSKRAWGALHLSKAGQASPGRQRWPSGGYFGVHSPPLAKIQKYASARDTSPASPVATPAMASRLPVIVPRERAIRRRAIAPTTIAARLPAPQRAFRARLIFASGSTRDGGAAWPGPASPSRGGGAPASRRRSGIALVGPEAVQLGEVRAARPLLQAAAPVERAGADPAVLRQPLQVGVRHRALRRPRLGVVPGRRLVGCRPGIGTGTGGGTDRVVVFEDQESGRVGLRLRAPRRPSGLRSRAADERPARGARREQSLQGIGRRPVLPVARDLVESCELAPLAQRLELGPAQWAEDAPRARTYQVSAASSPAMIASSPIEEGGSPAEPSRRPFLSSAADRVARRARRGARHAGDWDRGV